MDTRDYHGFRQHKDGGRWMFTVVGFDYLGRKDWCSVLLTAGGKTGTPIDEKDRILVNGLWWSRRYWNH